jgi:HAD superfamily hydrolase (TIGR01458 family)
MADIKGFLIDLDGVIFNDSVVIEGAREAIGWLQEMEIPFRFLTNTTMKSRDSLCKKLKSFGIEVKNDQIFSAVSAAIAYIKKSGKQKCHLLLRDDAAGEFHDFDLRSENPDFIVVGDLGEKINFETLHFAFKKLLSGAQLIALQKNRYWISDRGYTMDAGAIVAMLEYASGKKAQVVGKPAAHFYALALADMHLKPEEVVMIGDDLETDVSGAQRMDIRAVLVKTGKFNAEDLEKHPVKPWRVIDSIADIKNIFI